MYDKGAELRRERASGEVAQWRDRLADHCDAVGLVRHEVTLRGQQLARYGLLRPAQWDEAVMRTIVDRYAMHKRPGGASMTDIGHVVDALVELGYSERQGRRLQMILQGWAAGYDARDHMSQSAWYRARASLLRVGFDIASPVDVSAFRVPVREIGLRAASAPDWYSAAA